jgi:hypothetical protein
MKKATLSRRVFVEYAGCFAGLYLTGLPQIDLFDLNNANSGKNTALTKEKKSIWWENRLPRIYHPNMRGFEALDLDIKSFIRDCAATNCEAIVMSAGGIWAFYQTKIKHHVKSPAIGNRDLLAEVVEEAKAKNLRVIARVDFRMARPELYQLHPDWFQMDDNEKVCQEDNYYSATPLGGYQNEAFAIPVMRELLTEYEVDGIHLNAAGFRGIHRDKRTMEMYGGNESGFMEWREHIVADQIKRYREAIHSCNPEALLMGELAGIRSVGWAERRGWNPKYLARGFTNLLSTSGRIDGIHESRWWPGLTVKLLHAAKADGTPLVNLKMQYKKYGFMDFLLAPSLYKLNCYQSIANGAGLKTPTLGLIGNKHDPRTSQVLAEVFGFMKTNDKLLSSAEELAPIALVVPKNSNENTNEEFVGLAQMLIQRHFLFRMIHEEDLKESIPDGTEAILIPTGEMEKKLVSRLEHFAGKGGIVLVCSSNADKNIAGLLGIQMEEEILESNYVLAEELNWSLGPIGLVGRPGLIKNWGDANVLMVASDGLVEGNVVEEYTPLIRGKQPIAISKKIGKGRVVYFAAGLGFSYQKYPNPDYSCLLEKLIALKDTKKVVLLDGPDAVQVTAFRKNKQILVHLVNGSGNPSLEKAPLLGPMSIKLPGTPIKKAILHTPGDEDIQLVIESNSNESLVRIPQLGLYGLVELLI